jgi:hypothetical protein
MSTKPETDQQKQAGSKTDRDSPPKLADEKESKHDTVDSQYNGGNLPPPTVYPALTHDRLQFARGASITSSTRAVTGPLPPLATRKARG